MRFVAILSALVLASCATAPPPAPIDPTPAHNRPETAWFKRGATDEEFQRARSTCIVEAESGSGGNTLSWTVIFPNCMRAQGWVLIPKGSVPGMIPAR